MTEHPTNKSVLKENILLRTALSNLVSDLDRALRYEGYNAAHLLQTKYFVEARELLHE